jgi:hypothetical protein
MSNTVTISIEEYDSLRALKKGLNERKTIKSGSSYSYYTYYTVLEQEDFILKIKELEDYSESQSKMYYDQSRVIDELKNKLNQKKWYHIF